MTIEESAEKLNQAIEWIVTNSGDVRSDVKRLLLKKLQAERNDMRAMAAEVCNECCPRSEEHCPAWLDRGLQCPECPKDYAVSIMDLT